MDVESLLKKDYVCKLISENKRIDGRAFDEPRKISIIKGYVKDKAEGSALVKIGDTQVIAGVKLDVGEPFPDTPDEGVMTVNAEFRPMASPSFESGPPNPPSIELARVVDRGIRESKAIDMKKLVIQDTGKDETESISMMELEETGKLMLKKKVWVVFVDIHVIDACGNLIDAAGIAAMAALLDTRIPKYEDGKIIRKEYVGKLPVTKIAVPTTIAKINNSLIIDPDENEECAMDARLTITTTDNIYINAMQKGGTGSFTLEEIQTCIDMAFKNSERIRKIIEES